MDQFNPEQIEKAFNFCQLSNIENFELATEMLQTYNWNVQIAMNALFQQQQPGQHPNISFQQVLEESRRLSEIQENEEKKSKEMKELEEKLKIANMPEEEKDKLLEQGKKEFKGREISDPITIKFRLFSKMEEHIFSLSDTIQTVFRFTNYCLRDGFDKKFSDFDIFQTYPLVTLGQAKEKTLKQMFPDSKGEVFVIKEVE